MTQRDRFSASFFTKERVDYYARSCFVCDIPEKLGNNLSINSLPLHYLIPGRIPSGPLVSEGFFFNNLVVVH